MMLRDVTNVNKGGNRTGAAKQSVLGSSFKRTMSASQNMGRAGGSRAGSVAPAGGRADSRPITDKGWQRSSVDHVQSWLVAHGYDGPAASNTKFLFSFVTAEFFAMIEFIYNRSWAPTFKLPTPANEAAEAAIVLLKALKYPFSVSRMNLISQSTHQYAANLGILLWLVELAEADEACGMGPTTIKKKDEEETPDQLWMNYLAALYKAWMGPQPSAAKQTATEKHDHDFHNKLSQYLSQCSEAELELERQKTEADKARETEEQKLAEAMTQCKTFETRVAEAQSDIPKLDQLIQQFEQRNAELEALVASKKQELAAQESSLQGALSEKASLEVKVQSLGFPAAERERVVAEKASAEVQLQGAVQLKERRHKEMLEMEATVAKALDQVEKKVHNHQDTCHRLRVAPVSAKHARGENLEATLGQSLTSTPAAEEKLLADLKSMVRPGLCRLTAAFEEKATTIVDEQLKQEDTAEKLIETVQELEKTAEASEGEVKVKEEVTTALKEKVEMEVKQQQALIERIATESAAVKETAAGEVAQARSSREAADSEVIAAAEKRRSERALWERELMTLNAALVEHKTAMHNTIQSLVEETRALVISSKKRPVDLENSTFRITPKTPGTGQQPPRKRLATPQRNSYAAVASPAI